MCSDVSLHFPVINDVEHVCMNCLPSISHLWGYVCSNICPTCFFIFSFSLSGFENSLSVLNTSSLSQDTFKKENKKISPGLGENLCELCIWQRVLKNKCFLFYEAHFIDLFFYGCFWENFCPLVSRFPMVIFSFGLHSFGYYI